MTEAKFIARVTDRPLRAEGICFTIRSDGGMTGEIDGVPLAGQWIWRDALFFHWAALGGEELGSDCELIEVRGNRMRYIREEGRGAASVVEICEPD
ncbi:hypothetical protein [Allosediminivita pacifica]|uniref:Uncharacterized protein n=1 Tax=Allosediminivita pacifica TaxID=1267769 RepID=A0A2T6APG2_9RHOB|nr:hypothetical protein [Allosediminivita pacifica]PTX45711.1 hypothetical protein C8N44_12066 [Allosediminivita pacifica]GGB07347.1 hypothetical protein GCM10011324_16880 [Allosediminivita pacifica]